MEEMSVTRVLPKKPFLPSWGSGLALERCSVSGGGTSNQGQGARTVSHPQMSVRWTPPCSVLIKMGQL